MPFITAREVFDRHEKYLDGKRRTKRWGNWVVFVGSYNCIEHEPSGYWIGFNRLNTCAEIMDWLFQLRQKTWFTSQDASDFLTLIDDVLHPQATLCSFGQDRGKVDATRMFKTFFQGKPSQ